jgi:hypothetical protein
VEPSDTADVGDEPRTRRQRRRERAARVRIMHRVLTSNAAQVVVPPKNPGRVAKSHIQNRHTQHVLFGQGGAFSRALRRLSYVSAQADAHVVLASEATRPSNTVVQGRMSHQVRHEPTFQTWTQRSANPPTVPGMASGATPAHRDTCPAPQRVPYRSSEIVRQCSTCVCPYHNTTFMHTTSPTSLPAHRLRDWRRVEFCGPMTPLLVTVHECYAVSFIDSSARVACESVATETPRALAVLAYAFDTRVQCRRWRTAVPCLRACWCRPTVVRHWR